MSAPEILSQVTGDSARARGTDPETSHAAADSITVVGREDSEVEVVTILREATGPVTAEQIVNRHNRRNWRGEIGQLWTGQRLRTALKQLADDGLVVRVGEDRTATGRRAATWELANGDAS